MKALYKITLIAALLGLSATMEAQVYNSLIRDIDPAAAGISGASVAMETNAYSLDNNPAAMVLGSERMEAGAGYGILQPSSVKMGALSVEGFYKLGEKFALGAGYKGFSYETYSVTNANGTATKDYTPKEMALSLGAAYLITDNLSAGLKVSYASLNLGPDTKYNAFGADLGVSYTAGALTAGLDARNLGSSMTDVRAGAAYRLSSLSFYGQAEYLAKAGVMAAVGAQYSFKDMLYARCGGHYGNNEKGIPSHASLGLGVKWKGFSLDAAILLGAEAISGTSLFSLGYSF